MRKKRINLNRGLFRLKRKLERAQRQNYSVTRRVKYARQKPLDFTTTYSAVRLVRWVRSKFVPNFWKSELQYCFGKCLYLKILFKIGTYLKSLKFFHVTLLIAQWVDFEAETNHALRLLICRTAPRELKNHERDAWFLFSNDSISTHWAIRTVRDLILLAR